MNNKYYVHPSIGEMVFEDGKSSFKALNPNECPMDGVNVLLLGGNMTLSEKEAENLGSILENFLKLLYEKVDTKEGRALREDIHILPFVYGQLANGDTGRFTRDTTYSIAEKLLLSRCLDGAGNRLSPNEACKQMSKTVFFTYCHGAVELDKILFALKGMLGDKGYDEKEVREILNATGQVSFAPEYGGASVIPTINFNTKYDPTTNNYKNELLKHEGMFKPYDGIELRYFPKGKFWDKDDENLAESVGVYSAKYLNAFENNCYEHLLSYLKRNEKWDIIARNRLGQSLSGDDARGEKVMSPNADASSQMMAWALCRLVEHGLDNLHSDTFVPRMSFAKLMDELKSIKDSFEPEQLL